MNNLSAYTMYEGAQLLDGIRFNFPEKAFEFLCFIEKKKDCYIFNSDFLNHKHM